MENYTEDSIRYILKYCIEIKDIKQFDNILLGSTIRYFSKTKEGYKFRSGGTLLDKSGVPKYIRLYNKGKTWSVQLKTSIIFYEFSNKEKYQLFENLIDKQESKIILFRDKKLKE